MINKLVMKDAAVVSRMWKKLNSEGISLKELMLNDEQGFIVISEDDVSNYASTLDVEHERQFKELSDEKQKGVVKLIKEQRLADEKKYELIDTILANYYIVENDILILVCRAAELEPKEAEKMPMDEYLMLVFDVLKENIDFFTSAARLKIAR